MKITALCAAAFVAALPTAALAGTATGHINASGAVTHSCSVNNVTINLTASGDDKTLTGSAHTRISQTGTSRWYLQHTNTTVPSGYGNGNSTAVDTTVQMGRGNDGPVQVTTSNQGTKDFLLNGSYDGNNLVSVDVKTRNNKPLAVGTYTVTGTMTCVKG